MAENGSGLHKKFTWALAGLLFNDHWKKPPLIKRTSSAADCPALVSTFSRQMSRGECLCRILHKHMGPIYVSYCIYLYIYIHV